MKIKKQIKFLKINSDRVFRYKKDLLSTDDLNMLNVYRVKLKELLKINLKDLGTDKVKELEEIDKFLVRIGGKVYPKTFWIDNIEVGLVALVVVLGIRTFFFQPFIIPTNSMYPTYSGMNEKIYDLNEGPKKITKKLTDFIKLGSKNYNVISNKEGYVSVEFFSQSPRSIDSNLRKNGFVAFKYVKGKKWFGLIPATFREYNLYIGDNIIPIRVPMDYNLDNVILKSYFSDHNSFYELFEDMIKLGKFNPMIDYRQKMKTKTFIKENTSIISFDITLGDALFVDRISYHFSSPKIGDPFVFKTSKINSIDKNNQLGDKYYIKRIAGKEHDTLSIRSGSLYNNGKLRDEEKVFILNSEKYLEYNGYQADGLLLNENIVVIPESHYFALGDNSYNSYDSRYWGYVPKEALIGKAIFIYYPFTSRWGLAK